MILSLNNSSITCTYSPDQIRIIKRKSIRINHVKKMFKKECQIKRLIHTYETEYDMTCNGYETDYCTYLDEDIEGLQKKLKVVQKKQNSRLCKIHDNK